MISAVKAGAVGYLPKNAVSSELVEAIRTLHRGDLFLPPAAVAAIVADYVQQVRLESRNSLTERQREVLTLSAKGYPNQVIAEKLQISPKTILAHRAKSMKKLDLHTHTDLIKYAIHKGLIKI
jgi:two-component system response regulator NreC